jgi:hypothetical protein
MPGHEHQIAPNDLRRPLSWPREIRAEGAREAAKKATREADRAEAEAWSVRMDGYGDAPDFRIATGASLPGRLSTRPPAANKS